MKILRQRIKSICEHIYGQKQRIFLGIFLFIFNSVFLVEANAVIFKDPIPETREKRLEIADQAIKYVNEAAHAGLLSPFSPKRFLYRFEWPEAFDRAYRLSWDPQYIHFREGFNSLFWRCNHPDYNCVSVREIPIVRSILELAWEDIQNRFYLLYQEKTDSNNPNYWAEKGLIALDRSDIIEAIQCINKILDNQKVEEYLQGIQQDASYLHIELAKGYIETNQFSQALDILNNAIKKDPENKEAYFQRATAYFELGSFEESLQDYITSKVQPTSIPKNSNLLDFSLGLSEGIIKGGAESTLEYIPSLLSSMYGLGQGLWAFVQDPVNISYEMVQATQTCIEFIRTHTPKEYLGKLVPELQYLIENWDTLDRKERGVISGNIIGKYGVDIFAGMAMTKGIRSYQNLKRANNIMTYEAIQLSKANKQLIKTRAKECLAIRKEMIKRSAFIVEIDKQTKHIAGSWNYKTELNRSIWTHPNPQEKINKFGGKGIRVAGELGEPGYREIIDCKEIIGIYITNEGKTRVPTTMAKIHYSKKGAHIVPAAPK